MNTDKEKIQNSKEDCILDDEVFDSKLLIGFFSSFLKIIILWIITKEKIHGYQIIKKFKKDITDKNNKDGIKGPGPNKIYPILHDLEKKELIIGNWDSQGKRKVKYYEATEKGINTINMIRKNKPNHDFPPVFMDFWFDVINYNK